MAQRYKHTLAYPQLSYPFFLQFYSSRKSVILTKSDYLPTHVCTWAAEHYWKIHRSMPLVLHDLYDRKYPGGPQYCQQCTTVPSQLNILFSQCLFPYPQTCSSIPWSLREQSSYWPKHIMNLLLVSIRKQKQSGETSAFSHYHIYQSTLKWSCTACSLLLRWMNCLFF